MTAKNQFLHVVGDVIVPVCLIVLIPMIGMFWVVERNGRAQLEQAQIAACERGNVLRERFNEHLEANAAVYRDAAAALQDGTAETEHMQRLAAVLAQAARDTQPVAPVDCAEVVRNP